MADVGTLLPGLVDPSLNPFTHPAYSGNDPAYAAWLAQADLQGTNALSTARLRRKQAEDAYQQALVDLQSQSVSGRRNIQTGMLQRGMFRSGEFDRRKQEYDSTIAQGRERTGAAYQGQLGSIEDQQRNTLGQLGMQGVEQVSQAMLRDSLAAYNAQQTAAASAAAPAPQVSARPPAASAPQPTYNPVMPAVPTYNPVTSSASLYASQSLPKPKPASGTTGKLSVKRVGSLQ